jgi:hypothetical protein
MNSQDFERYTTEYDSINAKLDALISECTFWPNIQSLKEAKERIIRRYQYEKADQDKSGKQMSMLDLVGRKTVKPYE